MSLFYRFLLLFGAVSLFWGQAPAGYYTGTETLEGYALKSKLHEIISSRLTSWNYGDLPDYFAQTDVDRYYENDGTMLDIYSEQPDGPDAYNYSYDENQLISGAGEEGLGWNREHIFSQSYFNSNYPMYSDIHFIVPTDARMNQRRQNWPFTVVGNNPTFVGTNGMKFGHSATPGRTTTAAEPIDEFKGDVARMLLYMVVRYEGLLNTFNPDNERNPMDGTEEKAWEDWYIPMLLEWHTLDPVSARETDRNNLVFGIQGNRNPFVDHPEWVEAIWGNLPISAPIPQAPDQPQVVKKGARFISFQWPASAEPSVLGYRIFVNGEQVSSTKGTQFTLSHLEPSTSYQINVAAYNSVYVESALSQALVETTEVSDGYAPDLIVSKILLGTGNNKAFEIYNNTGYEVDLRDYTLTMQLQNTQSNSFYLGNGLLLEGSLPQGERRVLINPKAAFPAYTANLSEDLVTASLPLTFTGKESLQLRYQGKIIEMLGYYGQNDPYVVEQSLYRNADINQPNKTFTPSEWTSYPKDYSQGLGETLAVSDPTVLRNAVRIYPNPVKNGLLYFSGAHLEKIGEVQLFDSQGRLVKSFKQAFRNGSNVLNLTHIPSGVYFVRAGEHHFKIVVE